MSEPLPTPRIEAHVWWCGDECDCTQPTIELVERERVPNPGAITWRYRFTRLWEGRFVSDSWEYTCRKWPDYRAEEAERMNEFRKAARRFGVVLHVERFHSPSGRRVVTEAEAVALRAAADKLGEAIG